MDRMKWEFEASFDQWEAVWKEIDLEFAVYHLASRERRQLMTAVEEIVANIIFYAGTDGRRVKLEISVEVGEVIWMEIRDNGKQFDPLKTPSPALAEADRRKSPGGLGIYMARRLTDEMNYKYKEGKNCLVLIKRREADHHED